MATAPKRSTDRTDLGPDFYIPAASLPSARGRVESFLTRHLSGHGRVLIPDTYNK
jgi:hypothetical protein